MTKAELAEQMAKDAGISKAAAGKALNSFQDSVKKALKKKETVLFGCDVTQDSHTKVGVLDGRHAHNPWLQELSDPVSKLAWDNYQKNYQKYS